MELVSAALDALQDFCDYGFELLQLLLELVLGLESQSPCLGLGTTHQDVGLFDCFGDDVVV